MTHEELATELERLAATLRSQGRYRQSTCEGWDVVVAIHKALQGFHDEPKPDFAGRPASRTYHA